jgi:hypothetical protein
MFVIFHSYLCAKYIVPDLHVFFCLFFETRFCYVTQAGLELLILLPHQLSARIKDIQHHAWLWACHCFLVVLRFKLRNSGTLTI